MGSKDRANVWTNGAEAIRSTPDEAQANPWTVSILVVLAVACGVVAMNTLESLKSVATSVTSDDTSFRRKEFELDGGHLVVAEFTGRDPELHLLVTAPRDVVGAPSTRTLTLPFDLRNVTLKGSSDPTLELSGVDADGSSRIESLAIGYPLEDVPGQERDVSPSEQGGSYVHADWTMVPAVAMIPRSFGTARGSRGMGSAMTLGMETARELEAAGLNPARVEAASDALGELLSMMESLASPSPEALERIVAGLARAPEPVERVREAVTALVAQRADLGEELKAIRSAIGAGLEVGRGLPDDHSALSRVDEIDEILAYRVLDRSPSGSWWVEATSLLTLVGEALADGASVNIELGQFSENEEFDVFCSIDGGDEFPVDASPYWEDAIPSQLADALGYPASQVAHVSVGLPAGTDHFEITVVHLERRPVGPLQSWYFGAQDFGRQAQLKDGYEAFVLWNRPLDRRGIEGFGGPSGDLALEEISWREVPLGRHSEWRERLTGLEGFHAKAAGGAGFAIVQYTVDLEPSRTRLIEASCELTPISVEAGAGDR